MIPDYSRTVNNAGNTIIINYACTAYSLLYVYVRCTGIVQVYYNAIGIVQIFE